MLALVLLLTPDVAGSAEEPAPPPDSGARAVELGRSALAAYSNADWSGAYARFAEAEALVHSPVFVLYMARCQRNRGKLLHARELLRSITREPLAQDAPAPWAQAVVSAHAELGAVQQVIPSVSLRVRPGETAQRATIDGRDVPPSSAGTEIELDPGEHTLEVWRDGSRTQQVIRLPEGRRRMPLWLPLEPAAAPPAPAGARGLDDRPSLSRVLGYSALGAGALGIAAGVVTGLIAKGHTDEITRDDCAGDSCYASARQDVEAASDWAALSTVSFIFGGSALAAGAGILLFTPTADSTRAGLVMHGAF